MSIGKVSAFDMNTGVWSSYIDRLEMYFTANDVSADLKLPTLIAVMGDEPYELLVNLASPSKPSTLSYTQAVDLLRQHLQPEPSSLAERYRFRQRRQGQEENIATYVAELKKLSRFCKFDTSLNDNLRDQFVCGLRSDIIRQRLFAENTISYAGAVKLATSLEAAERDAAAVEAPHSETSAGTAGGIHALNLAGTVRSESRGHRGGGGGRGARAVSRTARDVGMRSGTSGNIRSGGMQNSNCSACGAYNHSQETCRFRNYECSKCQQVGHLRRVCLNWGAPGASRGGARHRAAAAAGPARGRLYFGEAKQQSDEDIEEELHHLCLNDYKPKAVRLPYWEGSGWEN